LRNPLDRDADDVAIAHGLTAVRENVRDGALTVPQLDPTERVEDALRLHPHRRMVSEAPPLAGKAARA
jgi:hypothetical protein